MAHKKYLNLECTPLDNSVESLVPRIDHQLEQSLVCWVICVLQETKYKKVNKLNLIPALSTMSIIAVLPAIRSECQIQGRPLKDTVNQDGSGRN